MNKNVSLIAILFLNIMILYGQDDMVDIISPLGGSYGGTNIILDYTLGNWTVLNMENSNSQIGTGIFNEGYLVTNTQEAIPDNFQMRYYPNPALDYLYIRSEEKYDQIKSYKVFDQNGKLVSRDLWPSNSKEIGIDLSNFTSEAYMLTIYGHEQVVLKTVKFIKIK